MTSRTSAGDVRSSSPNGTRYGQGWRWNLPLMSAPLPVRRPVPGLMPHSAPPYVIDLESTVDEAAVALASLPESVVTWRPTPTAWSVKEIIGHLIDSATNNHQRF